MLLQLDASVTVEGTAGSLLAAIDDATGTVPAAVFREQEDAAGYLALLYQVVSTVGCPEAVYHDRHGIFLRASPARETLAEQLAGTREPTQVGRALRELGIASIAAHSPQAKGRVERLFGTLQDRLVAELHLAGACTLTEANAVLAAYLPRFNAHFAVPPPRAAPARRTLRPGTDPWQICCFRYVRTVGRDDTVRLGEHRVQLLPSRGCGTLARRRVEIREHVDGSLSVWHQGQRIATQAAPGSRHRCCVLARVGTIAVVADASATTAMVGGGFAALADPDREALSRLMAPAPAAPPPDRPAATHPWRRSYKEG